MVTSKIKKLFLYEMRMSRHKIKVSSWSNWTTWKYETCSHDSVVHYIFSAFYAIAVKNGGTFSAYKMDVRLYFKTKDRESEEDAWEWSVWNGWSFALCFFFHAMLLCNLIILQKECSPHSSFKSIVECCK